ncbi:MAG: RHS repeat-associated core domain-containing protein [Acidobacteria bacterium]|nr:RHS repeat-associated core domain-containing protein [Acidobacteriota bacterium]
MLNKKAAVVSQSAIAVVKSRFNGDEFLFGQRHSIAEPLCIDNNSYNETGSAESYFLADHLGSTNGLADATGSLTAQTGYRASGNATNAAFPTRYQFTGREFDSSTGLQFSRARFYDPKLGRFISEDPIGFAGGDVNLYGYVWNDPLHFVDPQGRNGWRNWVAWANERKWQAEQAMLESLEGPIYFAVGFGDSASLGLTTYFRRWQGIENVNWNCSVSYQAGGWAALAATTATGGVGLYRGGLSLATRASGSRVFWSGDPSAMKAAADFARANGGSTLEMTLGGRGMTAANPWLPRWASNPLWRDLSASFARGTRGSADAFLYSGGVRPTSIWLRTEMPILLRNGVQITLHTVP